MKLESLKKRWPWQKVRQAGNAEVRIEGERVILRAKAAADVSTDYAWRTDPELAALDATTPLAVSFREFERYYRDELEYPSPWSVRLGIDTLDGRHIGNCMYYDIDPDRKQAEIGIMIGDREFWGKGYGSDAVRTLLRHIFAETPMERVYLHTLIHNARAQKAFEKAGMRPAGQVRRDGYEFLQMEVWRTESDERKKHRNGDVGPND